VGSIVGSGTTVQEWWAFQPVNRQSGKWISQSRDLHDRHLSRAHAMTIFGEVRKSGGKKTIIQAATTKYFCGLRRHHGSCGDFLGCLGRSNIASAIMPAILKWLDQSCKCLDVFFYIVAFLQDDLRGCGARPAIANSAARRQNPRVR
jgi:hypothetical protein